MHHWMEFRVKWILTQCKKVFSKNKSFWTNGMGWPYKAESCPSTEEINKTLWQNILYLVKRLWAFEMSVSKRERWAAVVFIGLTSKFFCSSKNSFWFQAQRKQLNLRQENTVAVSTHSIFFFLTTKVKQRNTKKIALIKLNHSTHFDVIEIHIKMFICVLCIHICAPNSLLTILWTAYSCFWLSNTYCVCTILYLTIQLSLNM